MSRKYSFRTIWLAGSLAVFAAAIPAAAQVRRAAPPPEPDISFRPFFEASGEQFAAKQTFDAAFGGKSGAFWGGGLQIDFRSGIFIELGASRFSRTGARAFVSNGQVFSLGVPLKATVTPFEISAGGRYRISPRVVPYAGGGLTRYHYSETSDFSADGDDVTTDHFGVVVFGGAEIRVHRWIAVGLEAEFSRVSGILGEGGISKAFGENDLGGTGFRVKLLVGR
jgi:opacity protein-like surface antigen